jgi:hypothetical protein
MKTRRLISAAFLATSCGLAAAQSTVYESKDKAGPVFSGQPSYTDQPSAAKPIVVPPANLSQGVGPAQQPAAPAPSYTTIAIAAPANGDTIHTNTGAFAVRVKMSPALRTINGDRIKIKLDGNLLAPTYKSAKPGITAADWLAAAKPDNVEHTLQATVIDRSGTVLAESAPISFYAHRATKKRTIR